MKRPLDEMTPRERFLAVARFESPDYVPLLSCNAINGPNMYTVGTWQQEQGFPASIDSDDSWDRFWGMTRLRSYFPPGSGPPLPEPVVLSRDDTYEILRYCDGRVVKQRIGQTAKNYYGMPQFIEFPCKDRQDWERYRDMWLPDDEEPAYPHNWEEMAERYRDRDYPLGTHMAGSFSTLRHLFGTQRACRLFYTDPDLVDEILAHYRRRTLKFLRRLLREVEIDYAISGEDFCYRNGCLVSPSIFRDFIVPHYREQTSFLGERGVRLLMVDSDGHVEGIIGMLEEAGINGLEAFEVMAGNDVLRVRQGHPRFVIRGGLDKFAMDTEDPRLAVEEVERKVPPLLEQGGYFPGIDHGLPPTSFWRTYLKFMERLHQTCRNPEGSFRQHL